MLYYYNHSQIVRRSTTIKQAAMQNRTQSFGMHATCASKHNTQV